MILLQGQNLARHFGSAILFENIQITIQDQERIALVGRNGAGKSTLLKILAGIEPTDDGKVVKRKDIQIGYLDQYSTVDSDQTIWEEMLSVFEPIIKLTKEAEQAAIALTNEELINDPPAFELALKKYDSLQQEMQDKNAYGYESEIRSVLHGFRFYEEDHERPISQLSGGQKTRLALAKVLLEKNDLLILDEPTNHLDIETLSWLENYLLSYRGTLLIVSHDRYFLDKVASSVYEISRHRIHHYKGNYSFYLQEKAARLEQEMKQFDKQQEEIAKLEDYIARNIVRASTTKMAQSRRKRLEKMSRLEKPKGDERSARFSFEVEKESGNVVLIVEDGAIGYEGEILSSPIQLDLRKQQAIGIVGPNGIGKSTLLKTLNKELPMIHGKIHYGSNLDIGYYDQEMKNLTTNKTVLAEIWDLHPTMNETDIRSILGSFLFTGEDVEKTIHSLSGGERARLSLCKLALEKNNVLMLDEPTNHLDIDSKEVLENALIEYDGTLLFVSHDRYFINRIATSILELSENGSQLYLGDYDYYLEKKEEEEQLALLTAEEQIEKDQDSSETNAAKSKNDYQANKERAKNERKLMRMIESIEEELEIIEADIENIEKKLTLPEVFGDHEKVQEFHDQLVHLQDKQNTFLNQWEEMNLELEDLE
ncbi:MAG TPA: ATP-binding cassette domain-containing protein [Candidatus Jeotgalibaca pullicola]|uniref:ABC-F family ATP-binding cassette domain-containing protein n=1 Tax=Jeotgalibaca ciconiae TaxID=2496265 RepID=A0A3Q9BKQ0_9LACT|nr:ABC-F family ATP-binding cassette domain-containing protein [Jeotgalibaca ciconiae]AZP04563.1 ABC-F family ATP-binding cassette domain-containing protein [Jeotgalibaca ciconiae]HJB24982.1 ATP-binding cassette domain-containing protein [Candidatus Jeotgalibaca pullicola]